MSSSVKERRPIAEQRHDPHPAWVKFFTKVRAKGDGRVSRVVIQEGLPVFMETSFDLLRLDDTSLLDKPPFQPDTTDTHSQFSTRWSMLVRVATELQYCEFHDVEIRNGEPQRIGSLINKDKLI